MPFSTDVQIKKGTPPYDVLFTFDPKPEKISKRVKPTWRYRRGGKSYEYSKASWRHDLQVTITIEGRLSVWNRKELERLVEKGVQFYLVYPLCDYDDVNFPYADLVVIDSADFELEKAKVFDPDQSSTVPVVKYRIVFRKVGIVKKTRWD